jgi:hypothetical protein
MASENRGVAMRAADAVEKLTKSKPEFLIPHVQAFIQLLKQAAHIELKWHLALMAPRMQLPEEEYGFVWTTLSTWLVDGDESRIVRVNALQGLSEMCTAVNRHELMEIIQTVEQQGIPSLTARLRKIRRDCEM